MIDGVFLLMKNELSAKFNFLSGQYIYNADSMQTKRSASRLIIYLYHQKGNKYFILTLNGRCFIFYPIHDNKLV